MTDSKNLSPFGSACRISNEDAAEIVYEMYHNPSSTVRKRCSILYRYFISPVTGDSLKSIAAELAVSRNTVSTTIDCYLNGGVKAIFEMGYKGRVSCLDPLAESIDKLFSGNPPMTVREATESINEAFDLNLKERAVSNWLKKNGYRNLAPRGVPGKSDPEEQKMFRDYILLGAIQGALRGDYLLYFADGVHLTYGYSGHRCWAKERPKVKSAYGRRRLNCLGFLDASSFEVSTVMNNSYLNGDSLLAGLVNLRYDHPDKEIFVILDNAGYQRSKWVQRSAELMGVRLVFLPPYSPNLNLIERLWKFLRKKVVSNKYYDTFDDFWYSVDDFLSNVHVKYFDELKQLLTFNFEILDGESANVGVQESKVKLLSD